MVDNGQLQMQVGDVVQMPDGLYRVLVMTPNCGIFIQIETTRLNILRFSMDFVKYQISIGSIKRSDWKDEELLVKDLTDEEKEELNRKAVAIERMLQSLYPEWERIQSKETKPEIKELMQELGRSKAVTHRKIRNYLQSGRNPYSLVDGRKGEKNRKNEYKVGDPVRGHGDKTVANDEHLEEVFQDGYQYFLKGKEAGVSLKSAYRYLVGKHYMTQEYNNGILVQKMASLEEIPTYKRFWTYCNKQNDRNGITPLKMSAKERRNNARLLRGNSQSGCLGPGHIVEVDEVEIDMINVSSRDSRQVVGRAVMYLAIDVYSCCIVGCWVDYANNSFVGITNLLMALFFDGREQYAKYGLTAPSEVCPMGFIPQELRTDHGAEYTSEDMRRVGREIGMNIVLAPPATGSMKGIVEQSFHQFQELVRSAAGGTGVIMKTHDSKHYETACTDLDDIRRMAYRFVVYFNQHKRDGYPLTKEMIQADVPPIPASIWQYGCEYLMTPRWLTESTKKTAFFALLKTDRKFQISRRGVTYRGLFYENGEQWLLEKMWKTGKKKEALPGVRYDPRSINNVYLMEDGALHVIALNEIREEQRTFRDMSWKEYDELWKRRKDTSRSLEAYDLEQQVAVQRDMADVITTAKKLQNAGKNRKKNIREARKQEQENGQLQNTLAERLTVGGEDVVTGLPDANILQKKPETEKENVTEKVKDKAPKAAEKVLEVLPDDFSGMTKYFGV